MKNQTTCDTLHGSASENDVENLAALESMVWEAIKQQCANIDRSLFQLRSLYRLGRITGAYLLFIISIFGFLPPAMTEVARLITEQLPPVISQEAAFILPLFTWVGGGIILLLPFFFLSDRIPHQWVFNIYLYLWQPLCNATAFAITPLSDFTFTKIISGFIANIIIILFGVAITIGFLFLLRGFTIQYNPFLLTLISLKEPAPIKNDRNEILPNKTKLAYNVIALLHPKLKRWDKMTWQHVSQLIEHKSTETNLQTQYASFILVALALLGLLPIIISNGIEIVFIKIANFFGIVSPQLDGAINAATIQWVFVILLTVIVLSAIRYFLRTYQMSYVYEIIKLLIVTEQKNKADISSTHLSTKNKEHPSTTPHSSSFIHYGFMSMILTAIVLFFYDKVRNNRRTAVE
ncbi:MAG: hypothetical protein KDJ52_19670 [Anaerolineae bacterium]|nr:hypothetical protein [Anaerolineae bacterium]